jgi:hypothetical protein
LFNHKSHLFSGVLMRASTVSFSAFVAFALFTHAAWAANKCTAADGSVSFQDAPCASGKSQALNIKAGAASPAPAASAPSGGLSQAQLNAAFLRNEPLVGMTRAELDRALGSPTTVNSNNYAGVRKDQIIYERAQATWLVYTEAGIVTAIQNRPAVKPVAVATPGLPCPTGHEIRDAETSASSIRLSDIERAERQKAIQAMRDCGKATR